MIEIACAALVWFGLGVAALVAASIILAICLAALERLTKDEA